MHFDNHPINANDSDFFQKKPQRIRFLSFFSLLIFGKILLFSNSISAQTNETPHIFLPLGTQTQATQTQAIQVFGTASISAITVPTRTAWFPAVSGSFSLLCTKGTFCQKYQLRLLRSSFFLGFSDTDPDQGRSRTTDSHLPFANFTFRGLDLTFSHRLSISISDFQLFRSPIYLDEHMNIQESLATLRVSFGKKQRTLIDTDCFFDVSGPGLKYVSYASYQSVPFLGIKWVGIKQGCAIHIGKTIGATFGYAIKSELFLGQSGAGVPDQTGNFGAILSEHRAGFRASLDLIPSLRIQAAGIMGVHLGGWTDLFFHLNQGCIYASVYPESSCGSLTQKFEPRIGLTFTVDFGGPTSTTSKHQQVYGLNPREFQL